MASRQPDRCIPHVQEVFGGNGWSSNESNADSKRDATVVAERELKHIEKRMSMKKTIRKQISRQLAQAFVENQDLSPTESNRGLDCNRNDPRNTHNLTLTKCRMLAKMDANFLDLLRHAEEVDPSISPDKSPADENVSYRATENTTGNKNSCSDSQANKKVSLWKRLWSTNKR